MFAAIVNDISVRVFVGREGSDRMWFICGDRNTGQDIEEELQGAMDGKAARILDIIRKKFVFENETVTIEGGKVALETQ